MSTRKVIYFNSSVMAFRVETSKYFMEGVVFLRSSVSTSEDDQQQLTRHSLGQLYLPARGRQTRGNSNYCCVEHAFDLPPIGATISQRCPCWHIGFRKRFWGANHLKSQASRENPAETVLCVQGLSCFLMPEDESWDWRRILWSIQAAWTCVRK